MNTRSSSLERIYLGTGDQEEDSIGGSNTRLLHLERYQYAAKNLMPGTVADIACGSGYGSYILATIGNGVEKIEAVDNNQEAISYAEMNYHHKKIDFIFNDAFLYHPSTAINNIVSLETIEHLPDPGNFVKYLSSFLAEGGRYIASAPVTPSMDANPFHLHDFTVASFKDLFIQAGLNEIASFVQVQKFSPFRLFLRRTGRTKEVRKNLPLYYLRNPGKMLLRIRSLFRNGFSNKYLVVVFEKRN